MVNLAGRQRMLSQKLTKDIHEQGQLRNANARLIQMFGYPLEELKTKNIIDLVTQAAREQVHQQLTSKSSTSCEVMPLNSHLSTAKSALMSPLLKNKFISRLSILKTAIARYHCQSNGYSSGQPILLSIES